MYRRAKLILNPVSLSKGVWNRLPEVVELLETYAIRAELSFTKLTEAMTESVSRAVREEYDLVIGGGGDGTISEIAAGLVGTQIPLGVLPIGTFNNIAHSLRLPFDLKEATSNIAKGRHVDIDVGVANGVYFFEAVGVGLDASLFPIGEEIKGGHYEKILRGAVTFLGARRADLTLVLENTELNLQSPMVVIANGPYYGAGFTIAPEASLTDGLLDVVTFECTKVELARHFALSSQNRTHVEACVANLRAEEVVIQSPLPLPAHADGKPLGAVPITCLTIPRSLRVIVPEDFEPGTGLVREE